jgi:hypothetical protein
MHQIEVKFAANLSRDFSTVFFHAFGAGSLPPAVIPACRRRLPLQPAFIPACPR